MKTRRLKIKKYIYAVKSQLCNTHVYTREKGRDREKTRRKNTKTLTTAIPGWWIMDDF